MNIAEVSFVDGDIARQLEKYTCENSNFQPKRNYISISHASNTVDELIDEYYNGFQDSVPIRLKCYKGYQMERDIVHRMKAIYGNAVDTDNTAVSAHDGLVQGHPDFLFNGYPADCKSLLNDEYLPVSGGKLPRRVYWQMQGYMLYMKKDRSLLIYESRQSGLLVDLWVRPNSKIQEEIEQKMLAVIREIKSRGERQ